MQFSGPHRMGAFAPVNSNRVGHLEGDTPHPESRRLAATGRRAAAALRFGGRVWNRGWARGFSAAPRVRAQVVLPRLASGSGARSILLS